jgi:hypothetical protein
MILVVILCLFLGFICFPKNYSNFLNKDPKTSSVDLLWNCPIEGDMVDLSGDGEFIVVGSKGTVFLFHRSNSTPLWNFTPDSPSYIKSVGISNNSEYIVVTCENEYLYLLSKSNATPIWSTQIVSGTWIYDIPVAISSDGQNFVVGNQAGDIFLFNSSNSTPVWSYNIGAPINSISISSNGNYFISGSNNKIFLFDRSSSIPLWNYSGIFLYSLALSSDGNFIIAGTNDRVYLFNKISSIPLWNHTTSDKVTLVDISHDGEKLIAGLENGDLLVFNKSSPIPCWEYGFKWGLDDIGISSNGEYLLTGTCTAPYYYQEYGDIFLFHLSNSTPKWTHRIDSIYINSIDICYDGNYFALGAEEEENILLFHYDFDDDSNGSKIIPIITNIY